MDELPRDLDTLMGAVSQMMGEEFTRALIAAHVRDVIHTLRDHT
jgi:hypothetical protein